MNVKILRRIAAASAAALMALCCALSVSAAGRTYYLPELGDMKITLPDDMIAVKRDTGAGDRYFSIFGINYDDLQQSFKDSGIYLQGMTTDSQLTATVAMNESESTKEIDNYNLLQANELGGFARTFLDEETYTACTVDEPGKPVTWLYFNARTGVSGSSLNVYQAITVYGGKSVSVTLQRNTGSVTVADYEAFKSMISSVSFGQNDMWGNLMPYILLGAVVLLVIVIIILIVVIVKRAKSRKKKSKNDKVLKELAGKYTGGRSVDKGYDDDYDDESGDGYTDVSFASASGSEVKKPDYEDDYTDIGSDKKYDYEYDDIDSYGERGKYSDADIDALLGDAEEPQDFPQALPSPAEEQEEVKDVIIDKKDSISEFFDDGAEDIAEQAEAEESEETPEEVFEEAIPEEVFEEVIPEEVFEEEEIPEEVPDEEEIITEKETPEEEEVPEEETPEEEEIPEEETPGEEKTSEEEARESEEEEYFNDEVLVREEVRKNKFNDSDDFFEEAPKRVIGVISSKDVAEAEEYDVIGEVEKKVSEVERETPTAGEAFKNGLSKAANGTRSFFTHCGYFATNLSREIKRSRAKKKRQKAEEERRRRAKERAARQKRMRDSSGLVQVRTRGQAPAAKRQKK